MTVDASNKSRYFAQRFAQLLTMTTCVSACWVSQLEKTFVCFSSVGFSVSTMTQKNCCQILMNFFAEVTCVTKTDFCGDSGHDADPGFYGDFYHDGIGATVQNLLIRSFCRRILTKGLWGVVICLAPSATFDFLVTVRLQDFNGILSLRDRGGYLWSLEFSIFGKNEAKRFSYREWSCPGSTASESPPLICLSVRCRTSSPAGWCSLL